MVCLQSDLRNFGRIRGSFGNNLGLACVSAGRGPENDLPGLRRADSPVYPDRPKCAIDMGPLTWISWTARDRAVGRMAVPVPTSIGTGRFS